MNKIFTKNKTKLSMFAATVILAFNQAATVYAVDGKDVQKKLTDAATIIQGILSGLVVLVGICVSLFIIIKRMPDADNPQEKQEVYRSVGRVWGLVALAAACIWVIPWVYNLFT